MKILSIAIGVLVSGALVLPDLAWAAGDAAAGKAKAKTCAGCHGANGLGSGANPKLAGKSEADIAQALKDYKSGKRANPMMKTFAAPLSDQDIENLAAYYASLK